MSTQGDGEQDRPWQDVAAELSQEYDPAKVGELAKELAKALDKSDAELPHLVPISSGDRGKA